ncbi:unnamed protein product [Rotaria sordida]|uniref:Spp2/MOS2 G-patch domain-containing protein n=1 Tax=Rotaria sordida TaxID=392033 RepID=A0A814G6N5_9BILA|nr:unnamed protein product [Rotaria sordida]
MSTSTVNKKELVIAGQTNVYYKFLNLKQNQRNKNETIRVHTIEKGSTNSFMNNFNSDENIIEEKEIKNTDYEQVPIEKCGMAVLHGMGYKDDASRGISNKNQVDGFVPKIRPHGL